MVESHLKKIPLGKEKMFGSEFEQVQVLALIHHNIFLIFLFNSFGEKKKNKARCPSGFKPRSFGFSSPIFYHWPSSQHKTNPFLTLFSGRSRASTDSSNSKLRWTKFLLLRRNDFELDATNERKTDFKLSKKNIFAASSRNRKRKISSNLDSKSAAAAAKKSQSRRHFPESRFAFSNSFDFWF